MELFTMTSLVLAIFGATYAAINSLTSALRQSVEKDLHLAAERAKRALDEAGSQQDEDSLLGALLDDGSKKIRRLLSAWKYIPIIQALTFVGSIYVIAAVAVLNWSEITVGHSLDQLEHLRTSFPWRAGRGMIIFSGVSNFLFLLAPMVVYLWLQKLIKAAKGLDA